MHKKRSFILFFTLFLLQLPALWAGKYFDFSPAAKDAYQKTLNLRFDEARVVLNNMKRSEPENLMAVYVENYLDFLTVFINDNEKEYDRLAKNEDGRLSQLASGDRTSPYYLFTQAEVRLQWAVLRGRFGDYLSSLSDIKQSYALLEDNQRKFSWFVANKKSLGIMHTLVGNVPEEYRWVIRTLGGMSGTTEQGLQELEEVLTYAKTNDFVFEEETLVSYAFLQLYLNNQSDKAWNTLKNSKLNPKTSPLAAYAMATVGMRIARNDEAIRLLQEAPNGAGYYPFHYRNYLLGLAKLRRLDGDANKPLQEFLNNFKGDNTVKEGYQKLAWYHLVSDNENGYRTYIAYAKLKGADNSEPDKAALREAKSGEMPEQRLLKARLLFDGGYYQRAYDLLKDASNNYTGNRKQSLEYAYRLGRITHKMGKNADAIRFYTQTIDNGAKEPWYFACNAALQLGILYESKKDLPNARIAYNRCLKIDPEEYASGLHAQAKAGLQRCGKK